MEINLLDGEEISVPCDQLNKINLRNICNYCTLNYRECGQWKSDCLNAVWTAAYEADKLLER